MKSYNTHYLLMKDFNDINYNYAKQLLINELNIDENFVEEHFNKESYFIPNKNLSNFLNNLLRENQHVNNNVLKFLTIIWKCFRIKTEFDGKHIIMYVPFGNSKVEQIDNYRSLLVQEYNLISKNIRNTTVVSFYQQIYEVIIETTKQILNKPAYINLYKSNTLLDCVCLPNEILYFVFTGELNKTFLNNLENDEVEYNSDYEFISTNITKIYSNKELSFHVEIQGANLVLFDTERKTITVQHKSKTINQIINKAAQLYNSYFYNKSSKYRFFEDYKNKEFNMIFNHVKYYQ